MRRGEADGLRSVMEAEAAGLRAILSNKAEGFGDIVEAANGLPELAALLLITEQLPKLVEEQVKAISNLKIDNITVWDGGKGPDGKTATAECVSGLVGALPPLHAIAANVGIKLPDILGETLRTTKSTDGEAENSQPGSDPEPGGDPAQ